MKKTEKRITVRVTLDDDMMEALKIEAAARGCTV